MTLDEVKAALERGRPVVLVTPPAVEQAGALWELVRPTSPEHRPEVNVPVLIICPDDVAATEWAAAAPRERHVRAVTGLARAARLLKAGPVDVLAGAVKDLTALVERSALKLEAVATVVVAWPEALVTAEHAGALDALLGEAREARRVVLSWNPALLGDFLERHARRALVAGGLPVDAAGAPLDPVGPARYAIVTASRRSAAIREVLDALDPKRPWIWEGGPLEPPPEPPDAVVCARLPSRDQFAALARFGAPIVLISAAQLPYLRCIAAPLAPLPPPTAVDRARDRVEALREQVARRLTDGEVDAELALLDPLFDRFDPAEVAAALLAIQRETGVGKRDASAPEPAAPAWVKVFVNIGKKDRAAAKDLVGALTREVGIGKDAIGKIDVRETFSLVDVAEGAIDRTLRGLVGVTIRGKRVVAKLDRAR